MPADKTPAEPVEATPEAPAPPVEPAAAPVHVTAHDFCAQRSAFDRRIELLAGFHADEVAAGRTKDSHEAFAARLEAFANRPV